MSIENIDELYSFWFGRGSLDDPKYVGSRMKLWFGKDDKIDSELRTRFAPWLVNYPFENFETSLTSAQSLLTQILLLDQVPRNSYRGTARAFASDHLAREVSRKGLALSYDKVLSSIETIFLLLPLEHSESLRDQEESVRRFKGLESSDPQLAEILTGTADYALRHHDIIVRFGRFPHRNLALGRESTREEIEFLREPGSSF